MPFTVPTLDELHEFLVALLKALLPDADVTPAEFYSKFLKVFAAGGTDNHAHLDAVVDELLPDTAEDLIERWGTITGRPRKGATPARKADALRVVGTPGSTVAVGDELVHASTLRFQVNQAGTIPAGGQLDVDVVAIDTGSATRLPAGEVLTFVAPPVGIEDTAELQLALDEDGDDQEPLGAYRLRILNRFSQPPLGGAQNDYQEWAKEVTGIAAAYAYPNRQGFGSVDLAALHAGQGTARILSAGEVTEVQAYVDGKRPVSVKAFRVLTVVNQDTDIEVQLVTTGEAAFAFDWDDQAALLVSAWTLATRVLKFQGGTRPGTMKAGDRLCIKTAAGDGRAHVIETLGPAADEVTLEDVPSAAPTNGDPVYAGGPLTELARAAILELVNNLGTANPDATRYGEWEGTLRLSSLYRAINGVEGVLDSVLVAPVANVEATDPAFPNDGTINLVTPRRILVRKKW